MLAWDGSAFHGAKAALLWNDHIAVLRRDDLPGLAYAGMIDLPGGGREAAEAPVETVLREIEEEIGLALTPRVFRWASRHREDDRGGSWFFLGDLTETQSQSMRLGSEGQACWMMPLAHFLAAPDAIPTMRDRLTAALA